MDNFINLDNEEMSKFDLLLQYAKEWAEKHPVELGVAEVALGAAAISYGVNTGAIQIGANIVATLTNTVARDIAISCGMGGMGLASLVGSIGIAACGTAIGIPAALVVGGAGWVFAASGYAVADMVFEFLHPIDFGTFIGGSSLLGIGLALVLDGVKRLLPQKVREAIKEVGSAFVRGVGEGVIVLVECTTKVIATTLNVLMEVYGRASEKLRKLLQQQGVKEAVAGSVIIGGAAGGAAVGTVAAASTVTVLGSHTLGAAALGLGLVSAPLWPVIAIGGAGALVGVGTWWAIKSWININSDDDLLLKDLCPA